MTEYLEEYGVKGSEADTQTVGTQRIESVLHFTCGCFGEGDNKNMLGRNTVALYELLETESDDSRLAGTGSGKNEHGTIFMFDGFSLVGTKLHKSPLGSHCRYVSLKLFDTEADTA